MVQDDHIPRSHAAGANHKGRSGTSARREHIHRLGPAKPAAPASPPPLPAEGCQFADDSRDRRQTTARTTTCWHWRRCSRSLPVGPLLTPAARCAHTEYAAVLQPMDRTVRRQIKPSRKSGDLTATSWLVFASASSYLVDCIAHISLLSGISIILLSRGFRPRKGPSASPGFRQQLCCCLWR